jgi:hypothetical protein
VRNHTCMIGSLLSCRIRGFLLIRVGICLLAISIVSKFSNEGVRRKEMDRMLELAGKRGRQVGEEMEEKRRRRRGGGRGHTVKPPVNNAQHH